MNTLWSQWRSKAPRYSDHNIERYMRKLLVYYPKNLKALMPISAEIGSKLAQLSDGLDVDHIEKEITRIETLSMQVLAKYNRSYIRHQNIDINYKDPYTYRPNKLETLRLYQSQEVSLDIPDVLIRALRQSKGTKHLEIDNSVTCCPSILKNATYIPGLESIFIHSYYGVSSIAIKALEKLILINRKTMKTITMIGVFPVNPIRFLRILSELPNLKTVTLEGEFPIKFDIRKIPFKMFKDRGISFHIKLQHSKPDLKFSTKNRSGLMPFDLLRLNYQIDWGQNSSQLWDFLVEQRFEMYRKAKRGLALDFPVTNSVKRVRVSKLLRSCKDVEVLDIGLLNGWYVWKGKEFAYLKVLKNLKHVYIELDNVAVYYRGSGDKTITCYDGFFRNLAFCAPRLQSISLHLYGEIDVKDRLTKLFKTCANTLSHLTLKFTNRSYAKAKNMDGSYNCLKELKQLISLKISYIDFFSDTFNPHANKTPFTCPTLKEISLMAPSIFVSQLNLNFKHLENLEKVQLCFLSFNSNAQNDKSNVFRHKFLISASVRHIELDIVFIGDTVWYKLLAELRRLPKLETLMLRIRSMPNNQEYYMLMDNIKALMKSHKSLKCVVFGCEWNPDTVNVFIEDVVCCLDEDIDKFYGRYQTNIPRRRMQRVYKVKKEITEEVVLNEEPMVQEKRGFTGFLKNLFLTVKSRYFSGNG